MRIITKVMEFIDSRVNSEHKYNQWNIVWYVHFEND